MGYEAHLNLHKMEENKWFLRLVSIMDIKKG